jgi:hypothetical protein
VELASFSTGRGIVTEFAATVENRELICNYQIRVLLHIFKLSLLADVMEITTPTVISM